jgi:hypothetical protein
MQSVDAILAFKSPWENFQNKKNFRNINLQQIHMFQ